MRREFLVPKLGLTMSEGVLVEWMVQPGERFKADQGLFVIESEKAANEIGAESEGVVLEITAVAGQTLPCGSVIGYWDDGQPDELDIAHARVSPDTDARERAIDAENPPPSGNQVGQRIPVTPLARRLAAQQGMDLARVVGSGPRGRIRAKDVLSSVTPSAQAERTVPGSIVPSAAMDASPSGTLRPASPMERTVAQRLTQAKQEIPHFYLSVEAEVSALLALRAQLNSEQSRQRVTLNHFILAAVGRALETMPEVNQVWTDQGILRLNNSDVGVAVSTSKGLLVPVLRDAGKGSLGDLARQADEAISRAQMGRLSSEDMNGGAITVSNAGMHDVTYMASIINPGQSMILGVGSIREVFRPDANGQPVICREMGLVLSADHRVLDGVSALKFLKLVVRGLSKPMGLLVA